MNLRDLKYLVSVADLKHFKKAAESCFVSQPALSMQLRKLEDELGVQLLERTNKQVIVTPIGKEIVKRSKKLLQEAEGIKELAKIHNNPFAHEFKLGAFPTLSPYLFPKIVPQITKALPKLKLFLIEERTSELIDKLKQGEIDAALLALPIYEEGLVTEKLFDDPFSLAVPAGHPFAKKKTVTTDELSNENLLLLEEGHCLRNQALEVCTLIGASESQDFRATSLETLRQMVISGLGITLIPKLAEKADKNIVYIPLEPEPFRTIGLVWRKTSAKTECFKKIVEITKDKI